MYFFFHLATGIIIGSLIGSFLHDKRWTIPCAIGAVLPDLTDKPIGHILFVDAIGYGRIYGHTLLVCGILMVLGIACWKYRKTPAVLAVAAGLLSHQVLDLMWREPANWFYPLLGPFRGHLPQDYLVVLLSGELNNPPEVILAIILGTGILLYLKRDRVNREMVRHRTLFKKIMGAAACMLLLLSGVIIGSGMVRRSLPYIGWERPEEYFIGGMVIALASYLAWRVRLRFQSGES